MKQQTSVCLFQKMEAPGVEPGSRNESSMASTGLVRHLSPRDRPRRTGFVIAKAEVNLAHGSYGADRPSQPELMASHPSASGGQTGEGTALSRQCEVVVRSQTFCQVLKRPPGNLCLQPMPFRVRSKPFRPHRSDRTFGCGPLWEEAGWPGIVSTKRCLGRVRLRICRRRTRETEQRWGMNERGQWIEGCDGTTNCRRPPPATSAHRTQTISPSANERNRPQSVDF